MTNPIPHSQLKPFHYREPLHPLDLAGSTAQPARTRIQPSDFAGILSHGKVHQQAAIPLGKDGKPVTDDPKLVDQTRKWVAQTFFGTLMKQMHESPFKSEMLEGGRGGQAFREMYDQHLIDHMSRGVGNKLVGSIIKRIEAKKRGAAEYERQNSLNGAIKPAHRADSTHGDHQQGGDHDGADRSSGGTKRHRNGSLDSGAHNDHGGAEALPDMRHSPARGNSFQNVRIHVAPGL